MPLFVAHAASSEILLFAGNFLVSCFNKYCLMWFVICEELLQDQHEIISFASSFAHWAHKGTFPLRNRHGWADKDWNWGSPFGTAHDEAMALRERLDTQETSGAKYQGFMVGAGPSQIIYRCFWFCHAPHEVWNTTFLFRLGWSRVG